MLNRIPITSLRAGSLNDIKESYFFRITVGHVGASVTQVSSLPQKTIPRSFERCGQIYSFVGILVAALNNIRCSTGFL